MIGRVLAFTLGDGSHMCSVTTGPRRHWVLWMAAASVLLSAACSDTSVAPTTTVGGIRVSVSVTGVDPPTIYSVVVAGRTVSAAATAAAVVTGLTPGSYAVTLRVTQNCHVDGDNPRTVAVSAGRPTAVVFSVTCLAATGSLRVTTVTTGVDLDLSGYSVRVDGFALDGKRYQNNWSVGPNDTQTFSGVPVGDESVTLTGMAVNCDPADATRRTVTMASSQTIDVAFTITCVPDTGQIAFVVGTAPDIRHISVATTNGSGVRRLTDVEFSNDEDPAWSPDGKKIAFTTDRDGNREIYVVNADGSDALRLTADTAADYEPAWSPDGARIAFVSERAGAPGIFVMNADGTAPVRLTTTSEPETDPAWSPDGRIAFASQREGKTSDIYVINADGSGVTRLTTDGVHPAWSPDGKTLAYSASNCQFYGCYPMVLVKLAAEITSLVDFGPGERPAWSPDGRKIAFSALDCDFYYYECKPADVRIARLDGSDAIRLASGSSPAWRP